MEKKDLSVYGWGFYAGICMLKNIGLFRDLQVKIKIFDLVRATLFDDECILADFIEARCFLQKDQETSASDLYRAFYDWHRANLSGIPPSQKKFGKMMVKKFDREKKGIFYYYDIGLISQTPLEKK